MIEYIWRFLWGGYADSSIAFLWAFFSMIAFFLKIIINIFMRAEDDNKKRI